MKLWNIKLSEVEREGYLTRGFTQRIVAESIEDALEVIKKRLESFPKSRKYFIREISYLGVIEDGAVLPKA